MITIDIWNFGENWLLHHSTWVNGLFLFAGGLFFMTWCAIYAHKDGKTRVYLLWLIGCLTMQQFGEALFFHPAYNHVMHILFFLPVLIISFFFLLFILKDFGVPPRSSS